MEQTIQDTRMELTKYERNLRGTMGKVLIKSSLFMVLVYLPSFLPLSLSPLSPSLQAIGNGLDSVRRITKERQLSGVYGPLIDNFTCAEAVFTAVEVTAGNRLVWPLWSTQIDW